MGTHNYLFQVFTFFLVMVFIIGLSACKKSDTPFVCGTSVPYGGKIYQTVQIGTQCWFRENLNIGVRIDKDSAQKDNGIIEKYCYDDNEDNCNTYGGLYYWDELMQYVTTEGVRGICPDGWHIPTDAEWNILVGFLGGDSVAGGKMKEAGTVHWLSPNTGATNSSGFTALPGGFRQWISIAYYYDYITYGTYFWSSSLEYDTHNVWCRYLSRNGAFIYRWELSQVGSPARCLRD